LKRCACLFLLLGSAAAVQAQEPAPPHFVRASADAVVSAKPDRAEITIGVSSRAAAAQAASAQNATDSDKVIKAIKQALGSGGFVKTSGYSLAPQYDYSNGHAPRLTGYEATNSVIVTVDDLPLLGKVIDSATQTGANNVNGIAFTLRDSSAVREQALAAALGVHVVGVLEAEPSELPMVHPRPMALMAPSGMLEKRVATPIEAGDLEIRSSVTVTLEVR